MAVKSSLLSLVFTDLVDSTALKVQLGDHKAGELIERHQERVRALGVEAGGREVDTAGDGFFLTFDTPSAAVTFALRLQQIHHDKPELPKVRVGVHLGEVSERPAPAGATNPLFIEGLAVDVAGRIQSLAEPGQVLMSQPVFDGARQRLRGQEIEREIRWRSYGLYLLKGIDEPVEIREAGFEGISPLEAPPDSEKATRVRNGGFPRRTLLAVGLVLIAAVATWTLWPAPSLAPIRSIAVLPFENLSGDPDQEYFADGMTEAIIAELGQLGDDLRVISRTSVMQHKGKRGPISEIARKLGVDGIVEGSVFLAGDDVRITAQLIHAASDSHVWSESYERPLTDVLRLQREVATAISRQVGLQTVERKRPSLDPQAYLAYLRGQHFIESKDFQTALPQFDRAIRLEPEWAPPHAGRVMAIDLLTNFSGMDPRDALPEIRAGVERALELDDGLSEAHVALAGLRWRESNWSGAEEAFLRALELNPNNSIARWDYAGFLWQKYCLGSEPGSLSAQCHRGQDEIFEHLDLAQELDPDSANIHYVVAMSLTLAGRLEEAEVLLREAISTYPSDQGIHVAAGVAHSESGRFEESLAELKRARDLGGGDLAVSVFGQVLGRAGRREEAEEVAESLIRERAQRYVSPQYIAQVFAVLGQTDLAFDWLFRGIQEQDSAFLIIVSPGCGWGHLPSDPRWNELLLLINHPLANADSAIAPSSGISSGA